MIADSYGNNQIVPSAITARVWLCRLDDKEFFPIVQESRLAFFSGELNSKADHKGYLGSRYMMPTLAEKQEMQEKVNLYRMPKTAKEQLEALPKEIEKVGYFFLTHATMEMKLEECLYT